MIYVHLSRGTAHIRDRKGRKEGWTKTSVVIMPFIRQKTTGKPRQLTCTEGFFYHTIVLLDNGQPSANTRVKMSRRADAAIQI